MVVFKNYDGDIIDIPSHIHQVADTVGTRSIGTVSSTESINKTGTYIDYNSGSKPIAWGSQSGKLYSTVNIQSLSAPSYGDLSIRLNTINTSSKYILYFRCVDNQYISSFASISGIKFSNVYPYSESNTDIDYEINKVNNIQGFETDNDLYEISFTGSTAPACLYIPFNMNPVDTSSTTFAFLYISLRAVTYSSVADSLATVSDTEDGFMSVMDKNDLEELHYQTGSMMNRLKRVLFMREENKPIALIDGATFNTALKTVGPNATSVNFTTTAIPSNKLSGATLISNENNDSRVYMYLDGTTVYISPEKDNDIITAAPASAGMFLGCNKLTSINFANFDTRNLLTMTNMFANCTALATITGINKFNTSKVTSFYGVFSGCPALTSLNLSTWDTRNVTTMYGMFNGCTNLTTLDISTWNTQKVVSMVQMFNGCTKVSARLTIMNTNTTAYTSMFSNCSIASGSKFTLGYSNSNTKTLATSMIATKSSTSNVSLPALFSATVTNAEWEHWAGGAMYTITRGTTINTTGDLGTRTYAWNVYKVTLNASQRLVQTEKVLATKTNNTISTAEYTSLGLGDVNKDAWYQVGFSGHNTIAGYVTITNTTTSGSETLTIYVGETFAKQYLPV